MSTAATLTLADFVKESENFEYSEEYFQIMKEASQLELMGIYLNACNYISENTISEETRATLMVEAANTDGDKKKAVEENQKSRAGKLADRVSGIAKIAWKALITVYGRVKNLFTGSQEQRCAALQKEKAAIIAWGKKLEGDSKKKFEEFIFYIHPDSAKFKGKSLYRDFSDMVEEAERILRNSRNNAFNKLNTLVNKFSKMNSDDAEITVTVTGASLEGDLSFYQKMEKSWDELVTKVKANIDQNKDKPLVSLLAKISALIKTGAGKIISFLTEMSKKREAAIKFFENSKKFWNKEGSKDITENLREEVRKATGKSKKAEPEPA